MALTSTVQNAIATAQTVVKSSHSRAAVAFAATALALMWGIHPSPSLAQVYEVPPAVGPQSITDPATTTPSPPAQTAPARRSVNSETSASIEMDVSTRSVAVTSAFTGTAITVFGAIAGGDPTRLADASYDIVIIVEGTFTPLVVRRKSNVVGLWINTRSMQFETIPSYYTIASTRPLGKIAPRRVLRSNRIGFDHVQMRQSPKESRRIGPNEKAEFREAVIRVKQREGLYKEDNFGVTFIGKSLFRSEVRLPANVPVGPLATRAYLFKDGRLIAKSDQLVTMRREGFERFVHDLAFDRPLLYGLLTVFLAISAGLIASAT
ncbi:MAG: TIGR02186 family protein, partial [Pseudomonadota bacterium]